MSDPLSSNRLHEALLGELINRIENGETVVKDGAAITVSAPAATLSAAIAFLKQFPPEIGQSKQTGPLSDTLARYSEKMPFAKRAN